MSFILVIFNIFIFYLKDTAQITEGSLLTTLGKSVAVVLGSNHACEVALFDKLRHEYKMHPSHSYYYEKYMNELAKIQTIVLKKYRELNKAFKEWDKTFFTEHNRLPNYIVVATMAKGSN